MTNASASVPHPLRQIKLFFHRKLGDHQSQTNRPTALSHAVWYFRCRWEAPLSNLQNERGPHLFKLGPMELLFLGSSRAKWGSRWGSDPPSPQKTFLREYWVTEWKVSRSCFFIFLFNKYRASLGVSCLQLLHHNNFRTCRKRWWKSRLSPEGGSVSQIISSGTASGNLQPVKNKTFPLWNREEMFKIPSKPQGCKKNKKIKSCR